MLLRCGKRRSVSYSAFTPVSLFPERNGHFRFACRLVPPFLQLGPPAHVVNRPENSAVSDWLPVESNRSLVEFTEEEEEDGLIETDETLHL